MKTLIYGAGPIGRWLALRLHQSRRDVTLLARDETYRSLQQSGIVIVDGLTGERLSAEVDLVDRLDPGDRYDLVVVAMQKASRLAVCPVLARNEHLENVLFLGNDVSGFHHYLDYLPEESVLLGFPGAGGGWDGDALVVMDREKPKGHHGELYIGELDGSIRERTLRIERLFEAADIDVSLEKNIDGWLKYHFAFMASTAGVIFEKGGDMRAVAADRAAIHRYCRACREAGDVLRKVGYRKRQPAIFNLYYWLPRWLEPTVFSKLFGSRAGEVRFGLHARTVGPELLEMTEEFAELKAQAKMRTPSLDALLESVPRPSRDVDRRGGLMKRVLVAGATGYLGGFVARELKTRGYFVRALARSPEKLDQGLLDEVVEAEVTRPETLEKVCDGIDVVFSSIGITKQKDKLTFKDVDYQGNVNLLEVARRSGVEKFVYVSVLNGPALLHLDIVKAHEDFVNVLKTSGIDYAVLRPTGYFSDMGEFLEMARKGRVYLIGRGDDRVNPIHGADLAKVCADAIEGDRQEIDVGGPEVLTYREIAELAFKSLGDRARITVVPVWVMKLVVALTKIFSRHQGELLAFFTTAMTSDVVAPGVGTHRLEHHFGSPVSSAQEE